MGGMDEPEYRQHPAISYSLLKEMSRSPAHFLHAMRNPPEETEQMLRGTLIHCMALEPDKVAERFVKAVDCDRRTKAGKQAWADLEASAAGRRLIPAGMWDLAERCVEAMSRDAETSMWLFEAQQGHVERPLFWHRQGVDCKGRPDSVLVDGTVVDVKTTQCCHPPVFVPEIFRRNYHAQGAFYRSGVLSRGEPWRSHVLVCVETESPYAVAVFRLDQGTIEHADSRISEWLNLYRRCLEDGRWPGYGLVEVVPPAWAVGKAG